MSYFCSNKIITLLLFVSLTSILADSPSQTLITKKEPFSRETMEKSYQGQASYGLLSPTRFSMSQSYTTSMAFSGAGSYSSGVYMNTLAYQIADPLVFSIDLGVHSPFYSSGLYNSPVDPNNMENNTSFVMPRMGLEYRPTDNTTLSLHYINGRDAYKTYGPFGGAYGWRSPFSR